MKKRLFSFSTLLLCSLLGFAQFSGSGSGTEADPYLITSPDELFEVRNSPSSYYKLMNDIDLGDWLAEEYPTQGWVPIQDFKGTFDGNGHAISNLFINRPSTNNVGLFGNASKATFDNITLLNPRVAGGRYTGALIGKSSSSTLNTIIVSNAHIEGKEFTGGVAGAYQGDFPNLSVANIKVLNSVISGTEYVGGCFGGVYYYVSVCQSYVLGGSVSGTRCVGGITGILEVGSSVQDCYVYDLMVSGTSLIGGIAGKFYFTNDDNVVNVEINNCYMSGTIESRGTCDYCAGIVAYMEYANPDTYLSRITNCRFDGHITGKANVMAGILAGKGYLSGTTPGVGGYASRNIVSGSLYGSNVVYGVGLSSQSVCCADTIFSTGGTAVRIGPNNTNGYAYNGMAVYSNNQKVEVEDGGDQGIGYSLRALKKKNTYIGLSYDFDNVWSIAEDRTFPYLKAQSTPPIITACRSGENGLVKGTASGNGTIYVFVGGKMYEGEIVNGRWSVPVSEMPVGAVVNVYAETDGMKPSCKISAISEPEASFVELDETSVTVPEAANDVDVLLSRTINADEWSTICLPFTATGEQVKAAFGDDVQLAEFTAWESEEDVNGAIVGINVTFTPASADDGIAANTPMIIKVSNAVTEAAFDGVTLEPEEEPTVQVGKKASERGWFRGTYTVMKVPEENLFLSGNNFWYSTGATTIKGYRGYFEFRDVLDAYYDGSEVKVNFFFDDEETGIRKLTPTLFEVEEVMYNLAGQRVDKAKKGIYIVNGKKQVIK